MTPWSPKCSSHRKGLKSGPAPAKNKTNSPRWPPNKRKRDGEQQTHTAPRAPRPAATDAFAALDGRGISPVPMAPGRPPNASQWDGERRTHIDPDSHAAWAFKNRRDGGSRHYQMFDPSWSTSGVTRLDPEPENVGDAHRWEMQDRFWAALEVVDASAVGLSLPRAHPPTNKHACRKTGVPCEMRLCCCCVRSLTNTPSPSKRPSTSASGRSASTTFLISVFLCVTSSVVCETGFSKLNLIKTKLRNRLCVPNLDNLMMVLCNGPNLQKQSK